MSNKLRQFGRRYSGGASLSFVTRDAVSEDVLDALAASADHQTSLHDWWAGPLTLDSTDAAGRLLGSLPLALVGYESEAGDLIDIDEQDDAFMGFMDLCVAVDWLAKQAASHRLTFELQHGEDTIGTIDATGEDDGLESFIVALGEAVGAELGEQDDERAAAIDGAHRDRLS